MATSKITLLAFISGIVLGGAATEGFNFYLQSKDSQIFERRMHCKAVADAFARENTDPKETRVMRTSVTLNKVDYSPARNSCVAEVEISSGALEFETVKDVLSGETLFSVMGTEDSANFRVMFLPRVWEYVMNNASEPVELKKEWTLMEAKNSAKSTGAASSLADPTAWRDVPATGHDASGKPIAHPRSPGTGKQDFYPDTDEPVQSPASKH